MKIEQKSDEYEGILWSNRRVINIGDVVYVYFFNIVDNLSRIMIKAHVIDDGFHFGKTGNEYCEYEKGDKSNTAIRIAVDMIFDNQESRKLFDKNNLFNKYGIKFSNFHSQISIDEKEELVKELEIFTNQYKKNNGETGINYFEKYFGLECLFKEYPDKTFFEYNHKTFSKSNGYIHYVIHHFIEQHNYRSGNIQDDVIYNNDNEIPLCPNCHDRIHHGTYEDRIKMISFIYKKRKKEIDKLLDKIDEDCFRNIEDRKNRKIIWLLKQYVKDEYITEEVINELTK